MPLFCWDEAFVLYCIKQVLNDFTHLGYWGMNVNFKRIGLTVFLLMDQTMTIFRMGHSSAVFSVLY